MRQENCHKFKASLVYILHFKLTCATEQDPVSKQNKINLCRWYKPSNWEAEAGELKIQGQTWLQRECKVGLSYMRFCFKSN